MIKEPLTPAIAALLKAYRDQEMDAETAWQRAYPLLLANHDPFNLHLMVFKSLFPNWQTDPTSAPVWIPTETQLASANIAHLMDELTLTDVQTLHQWSVKHYADFWSLMTKKINIVFDHPFKDVCDLSQGIETPQWFPGSKLNIANSCFKAAPTTPAIIYQDYQKQLRVFSYAELNQLSNQIANSLQDLGLGVGDAIGIAMPMNVYAVAIYLGILKMGGVVVSIADSFSSSEIAARLTISQAKAIFTQDFNQWGGKLIPLYEKVAAIPDAPPAIVVEYATAELLGVHQNEIKPATLRKKDHAWKTFLSTQTDFKVVSCDPMTAGNILFSSGTTAQPKAIIWNHATPIKAASDAFLHHNIKAGDVLAWPTNLGWMMGPWLIFAALINNATLALYTDVPKERAFGEFIAAARVTMLGIVPTLVASWRQTRCMENLNWESINAFSSTGECSNWEDMFYLMYLANYKPIIEYCGGTEVGGAYLSSTMIQNNCPTLFCTKVMGSDIVILDENGQQSEIGEVALIPPTLGLSTQLLNANHHDVYYTNMPTLPDGTPLRRHGDQVAALANGYYCVLGRSDDAMNLGGIKTSAVDIERTLAGIPHIIEVAAIALAPKAGGPSHLIIYAATQQTLDKATVLKEMQQKINSQLNPLFKIMDIVFVNELPKTASNKIMRRTLRQDYTQHYLS